MGGGVARPGNKFSCKRNICVVQFYSPFLSWRQFVEDDSSVDTVRGNHCLRELAQDLRVSQAVEAVPNREHVKQRPEHSKDHDREEVLEKVLREELLVIV